MGKENNPNHFPGRKTWFASGKRNMDGREADLPNGEPGIELSNMKQLEKAAWEVREEKKSDELLRKYPNSLERGFKGENL